MGYVPCASLVSPCLLSTLPRLFRTFPSISICPRPDHTPFSSPLYPSALLFVGLTRVFGNAPLLDLVESLELGNGDEDDDGLLSTLDVELLGSRDLENSELRLELGNVGLEIEDGLSDGLLNLVGGSKGGVGRSLDLRLERHLEVKMGWLAGGRQVE